ncbi:glyoxalase [Methylobacterium sp. Leaf123]|uniref:VOC family protein n=1 Tax=Methylobacterium sp. Leaf123 TaxID=1736264 RepID=UPI0006FEB075|nr:VOC family protein [Methylobacterium sp. Leaf123]KQQ11971.1 glyoxalase [Methylobacterium sp. Leaf123]
MIGRRLILSGLFAGSALATQMPGRSLADDDAGAGRPSGRPIRGIDHVGLAVHDIEAATEFLRKGLGAKLIYETLKKGDAPQEGPDAERRLDLANGARITAIRMLRLGHGPGIELFQIEAPDQRAPARASDLGWQHIAVYSDDLDAALRRFEAAGGTALSRPQDMPSSEQGSGNRFCYARAPFGALVEFLTYPSPLPYEAETPLRRWTPPVVG